MSDFLFSLAEPVQGSVIDVLQIGDYDSTRYGKFKITREDFDAYIQEFKNSNASGRRQVDFDHKGSQGDTRAAGWIQDLHVDGDKLKAKVEWTPAGEAAIKGKEYRFTSAEYAHKVRDKNTGEEKALKRLKAVTLTNRPFIDTMDPVSLQDDPDARIAIVESEFDEPLLSTGTIGGTKNSKLPKTSYAWVDADGVGHLPYKGPDGKIDGAHTRNALARLNQVKGMPDDAKSTARRKLEAALRSVGGHPGGDDNDNTRKHMSDLHTLLKLSEDADEAQVLSAVKALVETKEPVEREDAVSLADFTALAEKLVVVEKSNADLLRDTYLSEQIRNGRIAPAELVKDEDGSEAAIVILYNANPQAARKMIEARPINKMLAEIGGNKPGETSDSSQLSTDDIWTTDHKEGSRTKLDTRAKQLMADNKELDYGTALVLAEKEALA